MRFFSKPAAIACTLVILLLVGAIRGQQDSAPIDDEGGEYYDDYYEDGEEGYADDGNGGAGSHYEDIDPFEDMPPKEEIFHGYKPSVGGGVVKVSYLLIDDEAYINRTEQVHDCVQRVDSGILALEANETEEEEEPGIEQQVINLRKKMEDVVNIAASIANGTADGSGNSTNSNATDIASEFDSDDSLSAEVGIVGGGVKYGAEIKPKPKRMSFREKQEKRMAQRRAQLEERERLRPKFRLGADCETLICGACKSIVYEFGAAVVDGIRDNTYMYIEDIFEKGFCDRKDIKVKYIDIVNDICGEFNKENNGYKDALLQPFEADHEWAQALANERIQPKQRQVCLAVGACDEEQFEFSTEAMDYTQDHWDDKCFTCQAFARDLEERVQLIRYVTEGNIVPVVAATCDQLTLTPKYRKLCDQLVVGKLLDDIAWLAKVHHESVLRKAKGELNFQDKLCQEINWCTPWIDPEELKEKQAQETMEQVFF